MIRMSTPTHHEPQPAGDVISTEELIRCHAATPFRSIDDLPGGDPFGSDEEYEAFLADLYASRRELA